MILNIIYKNGNPLYSYNSEWITKNIYKLLKNNDNIIDFYVKYNDYYIRYNKDTKQFYITNKYYNNDNYIYFVPIQNASYYKYFKNCLKECYSLKAA